MRTNSNLTLRSVLLFSIAWLCLHQISFEASAQTPQPGGSPVKMDWRNLRNWMAYTTPYAELFVTPDKQNDQPLGSFLIPIRIRTPELSTGKGGKIGFYGGSDASLRFQSESAIHGWATKSHSMFSGIGGGYYSGLPNPFIDKVDVSINSLGKGVGLELTGK